MKYRLWPGNIKYKLLRYFTFFALIILAIMWLIQLTLINSVITAQKKDDLRAVGKSVTDFIDRTDNLDMIDGHIRQLAYGNGINIYVVTEEARVVLPKQVAASEDNTIRSDYFEVFTENLEKSDSGTTLYTLRDKSMSYVYGSEVVLLGQNMYVYVDIQMESVSQIVYALKYILFFVTIFVVCLSFLLSLLFSSNISRPVAQMSAQAKRLAKRDYNVNFEGGGFTEIDELADALNYAKSELMKSDDVQRQLIANVSHDLKTPLTMIKAYAEMIRDLTGEDKQKREKNTNVIIEETDRLTALVNDILNISKAGTGLSDIEKTQENLSELVYGVIEKFKVLEEYGHYTFVCEIEDELYSEISRDKIEQVIYNLVANAVNYTGDDFKVTVRLFKPSEGVLRFEVIDTGKGIPKEDIENIWDKYYRSVESHKRPVTGSGLGLSIVKSILVAHSLRYGVNSEVGEGSCFYIEFPAV